MDRIRSEYPWILDSWVVGLVQIFTHGFADLDICNTAGLERILDFARGCPLELSKFEPNKPT
jgi:hypothetical protein